MLLIPRLFLVLFVLLPAAGAQEVYVPESLREWQPWVLAGKEYRDCPFLFDRAAATEADFVCAWPGRLELTVDDNGGSFTLRWQVFAAEQWLVLPGNAAYWPVDVRLDGQSIAVVERNGAPTVRLGPGSHLLTGHFAWDDKPGVLPIPQRLALIDLVVNGDRIERPERDGDGLFLGRWEQQEEAQDTVQVQIFRLARDKVPARLVTRLQIQVSGRVREETFAQILPEDFVPLALRSRLPARFEADGILRVQVRPGTWTVEVTARGSGVAKSLSMPEADLVAFEVWSFEADDALRVVEVDGGTPVDPQQADVPPDWRLFPAFRLELGDLLEVTERSRGLAAVGNELRLARRIWLDFDGAGLVFGDQVGGTMRSGWRLDMGQPYALLSAAVDGENLLITKGENEGQNGVELRRGAVDLESIARVETRKSIPVTGWDTRFANVSADLNLPPGHQLFAAPGADRAPGSWIGQWQLLDFFLVLVITIATWRLFGAAGGILAFFAVTLSFHEAGAPAWLWLNLLAAIALRRVTPAGRFLAPVRVYEGISALLLVAVLVPFFVGQLRIAIFPQLERSPFVITQLSEQIAAEVRPEAKSVAAVRRESATRTLTTERMTEAAIDQADTPAMELQVLAGADMRADAYARYAPSAVVQAGPGKPAWRWNSYRLEWSGPVNPEQTMRLLILPSWAVSLLRFFDVGLLLGLAATFAAEILNRRFALPGGLTLGRSGVYGAAILLVASLTLGASPASGATTPDSDMLRELERRLLAPPACVPRCAEILTAEVGVSEEDVRIRLSVHALAEVAVPLPGGESVWRANAIRVDATTTPAIRDSAGIFWVRLSPGRHQITLAGSVGGADSIEIPFPAPPRVITTEVQGFLVSGIRDNRLVSGSLVLTRMQRPSDATDTVAWESSRFPAFAEVTRSLKLDLDWSVVTRVRRLAPAEGAVTLEIPLLPGENVLSEGVNVVDGNVLVTLAPDQSAFSWTATLPIVSAMTLSTAGGSAWQEIWEIGVGRTWHVVFSGLPESEHGRIQREAHTAIFYPRGGETLAVNVTRPEASAGSTLAFDSAELALDVGSRSRTARLALAYRSTRGGQHLIRLPEDAEVIGVAIDGRREPLRAEAGELAIPILPGEHGVEVRWRTPGEVRTRLRTPLVDVGAPASNISLGIDLPDNRWLLATGGPPLGPAVLYWPELAALILLALILGRIDLTPLKSRDWLFLGLGFSTFSWSVMALVVVWLLACGTRDRWQGPAPASQYNVGQVVLGLLTVAALMAIIVSLPQGLLGTPDMHVTGNRSFGMSLKWFADRSATTLPVASAWSVPLWGYKVLILGWALWLSFALLRWLQWVWQCFSRHGIWQAQPEKG